ncbi:MAG TPA: undecaprenyl diphosphate synthase family protein [Candidatus Acidoferrum sp.]|nr:undecaprenyl diphosphate synthase family protein [Candidatus Acidoferrum sp.]
MTNTDSKPALQHLAIIPDGNRRWAKSHFIEAQEKIYEQGSDKTFEIVQAAFEISKAGFLTFWVSSYANLAERPKGFAEMMEQMYIAKFHEIARHPLVHDNKIHIEICGRWRELLGAEAAAAAQEAIDLTANYHENRTLTILVGYDGRHERGFAVQQMLQDCKDGKVETPADWQTAEKLLRSYSWTKHLPDVDLIIRTGAWQDPHNSAGFLSLLTGESQYAFPEVLWPDFTPAQLKKIIDDFNERERRMGK